MSLIYETLDKFSVGTAQDGRVYQSGMLRLHRTDIEILTMTVMGRYFPENEATPEGRINKQTAGYVLEHLNDIISMAVEKLIEDGKINSINELRNEMLAVCDGVQVISGELLDLAVKFMTEKRSEQTDEPFIYDVLFHFPRNENGSVKYTLQGVKVASMTE